MNLAELTKKRLFEIKRTGDPYNKMGWNVYEYEKSFDESTSVFRGDISPSQGRERTILMLHTLYPGCRVRVER
jgi:hypothetical protein